MEKLDLNYCYLHGSTNIMLLVVFIQDGLSCLKVSNNLTNSMPSTWWVSLMKPVRCLSVLR